MTKKTKTNIFEQLIDILIQLTCEEIWIQKSTHPNGQEQVPEHTVYVKNNKKT